MIRCNSYRGMAGRFIQIPNVFARFGVVGPRRSGGANAQDQQRAGRRLCCTAMLGRTVLFGPLPGRSSTPHRPSPRPL
jgi:hypothetical protein